MRILFSCMPDRDFREPDRDQGMWSYMSRDDSRALRQNDDFDILHDVIFESFSAKRFDVNV